MIARSRQTLPRRPCPACGWPPSRPRAAQRGPPATPRAKRSSVSPSADCERGTGGLPDRGLGSRRPATYIEGGARETVGVRTIRGAPRGSPRRSSSLRYSSRRPRSRRCSPARLAQGSQFIRGGAIPKYTDRRAPHARQTSLATRRRSPPMVSARCSSSRLDPSQRTHRSDRAWTSTCEADSTTTGWSGAPPISSRASCSRCVASFSRARACARCAARGESFFTHRSMAPR
jgi:hypothetical protein